jgi:hypothetical protein
MVAEEVVTHHCPRHRPRTRCLHWWRWWGAASMVAKTTTEGEANGSSLRGGTVDETHRTPHFGGVGFLGAHADAGACPKTR